MPGTVPGTEDTIIGKYSPYPQRSHILGDEMIFVKPQASLFSSWCSSHPKCPACSPALNKESDQLLCTKVCMATLRWSVHVPPLQITRMFAFFFIRRWYVLNQKGYLKWWNYKHSWKGRWSEFLYTGYILADSEVSQLFGYQICLGQDPPGLLCRLREAPYLVDTHFHRLVDELKLWLRTEAQTHRVCFYHYSVQCYTIECFWCCPNKCVASCTFWNSPICVHILRFGHILNLPIEAL